MQLSYIKDSGRIWHIGPVAEDFYAAFGLGDTNKGISSVDTVGVALAAIKALKQENKQTQQSLAHKDRQISNLQRQLDELRQMLTNVTRQYQSDAVVVSSAF